MDLNIKNPFASNRKFALNSDNAVELTERGKKAAEDAEYSGAKAQVLLALDAGGSTTIKELSRDTRLPLDLVKRIVESLLNKAEARVVGING
jgi:predicted transcriptional regulator